VDELGSWYEVIRSLMPPSFDVRIVWESHAIVVAASQSEHMVWLFSSDLRGHAPGEVVERVRLQLQYANLPGHALVA
jgi:hypothetical protein